MSDYNDMSAKVQASEIVEDDKGEVTPRTISFSGPGANRWKEIYKMSPQPDDLTLLIKYKHGQERPFDFNIWADVE